MHTLYFLGVYLDYHGTAPALESPAYRPELCCPELMPQARNKRFTQKFKEEATWLSKIDLYG